MNDWLIWANAAFVIVAAAVFTLATVYALH
jgi:hypothetical protein